MEESVKSRRYFIDLEQAPAGRQSLSALIAGRRCYACRQGDTVESAFNAEPRGYVTQIAQQCTETPDYLLPDTPLKEAIFRQLLAGGDEPKTAEQISESLSARWAMTTYPRDISPAVIGRLLEHSQGYCITAVPEPPNEEADDTAEQAPD